VNGRAAGIGGALALYVCGCVSGDFKADQARQIFKFSPHETEGRGGGGPKERSTHHRRHHHPYGSRRSNKHTHTEVRSLCISKERLFFAGVSVRTLLFERAQERTDTACASDRLALPAASPVLSAYTSAVLRAAENNARAHCCTPLWPVVVFGR
jgi:hypothetical protein